MEKKQLYVVMIVSVVALLGIIGYRWLFPGKQSAPAKAPAAGKNEGGVKASGAGKGGSTEHRRSGGSRGGKVGKSSKSVVKPQSAGGYLGVQGVQSSDLEAKGVTDPKELRLRYGWAIDRSKKGAAQRLLERAISLAVKDRELVELGSMGCREGFWSSAKLAVARLVGPAAEKRFWAAYLKGLCSIGQGKLKEAESALRRGLLLARSDVQRVLVVTQQCRLALDAKRVAQARGLCMEALRKSQDERALFQAGRLQVLGESTLSKGIGLLERSLRLQPQQEDVALALAAALERAGRRKEAGKRLLGSAKALAKGGRVHGALRLAVRASKLLPKDARPLVVKARALRRLGRAEEAMREYRAAGELAKGDVQIRLELASIVRNRSVLDAVRVLEDAQEIDPANKAVTAALAHLRERLAAAQPRRRREQVTVVEGRLLKLRFSSWGGAPADIILKKKKYREVVKGIGKKGKRGKEQQVNLVRTWHPYWFPLRLDFDGSTFKRPPFPLRHPRSSWQYQSWDLLRFDGKRFVVHRGAKGHVVRHDGRYVFGYRWPVSYPGMAPPEVVIDRIYRVDPDKSYAWDMEIRVVNRSTRTHLVRMKLIIPSVDAEKEKRSFFNPVSLKKEAVCMVGDKVFMRTLSSIRGTGKGCMGCDASTCACRRTPAKGRSFTGKVRWVGIDEMYFLLAVAMDEKRDLTCNLSDDDHPSAKGALKAKPILMSTVIFPDEKLPHKGSVASWRFKVYSGPKISEELSAVRIGSNRPKLEESIDYGLFWFIGQPMIWMMKQIQKVVGNWGIAIILLTILIKLLTAPLTMKQMRSMKGMAELKPEIDRLKEACGDDKQRFQQEMWALYKSHNINPLGGCLPMFLQMPIYIAWYQALMVSVDLYRAPLFGWITDLTKPDAVHVLGYGVPILPLLMGATMFLQQRMTPSTADNQQAKMMMYMMPAMFTFFMLFLPSGLTLYILTNTVLTMIHQWYMNHSD